MKSADRLLLLFFLTGTLALSAQYEKDFRSLESYSVIPGHYLVDIKTEATELAAKNKLLKPAAAKNFFSQVLSVKKMVIESGDVYLPNRLTGYIDSIADALLQSEPATKDAVHIYLTRYSTPNAFCLSDGSIFVNLGLLNIMDNESELAFVIAHEIAHYYFQHSIKDYLKAIAIKNQENYTGGLSDEFRKLRFSRESEQEADSYALSLMNMAGFDPKMANSALGKLKGSEETDLIDYKSLFSNSFFTLDSILLTKEMIEKIKGSLKSNTQDSPDAKLDDLYETHPDLDKRLGSVSELQRNLRPSDKKRKATNYQTYKTLSAFELCHNFFREQDYLNTVLQVVKLQKAYPDNAFLISRMSASLYWLSHYKELSKGDLRIYGNFNHDPVNFSLLYLMYDKMNLKDSKQLAYAWLRSREEKIENLETPFFYLALSTENFLGKVAARDFYKRYESKFPEGSSILYVKNKLQ